MVEDDHTRRAVELDLGTDRGCRCPSSKTMSDIESDRSDQTTVKGDCAAHRARCGRQCQCLAQAIHQTVDGSVGLDPAIPGLNAPAVAADVQAMTEANERVSADLVALLDALEEETGA
jgi:hypothetical protein